MKENKIFNTDEDRKNLKYTKEHEKTMKRLFGGKKETAKKETVQEAFIVFDEYTAFED